MTLGAYAPEYVI